MGQFHAFCIYFVPLEYIPTIPPHSTYVIVQNTNYATTFNVLIHVDIYAFSVNTLVRNNEDVGRMGRYSRNILQLNETNTKSTKLTQLRLLHTIFLQTLHLPSFLKMSPKITDWQKTCHTVDRWVIKRPDAT